MQSRTLRSRPRCWAVNGAVEAARAGEYGKGFAVVSSDIQNLATEAAENAESIKDLVKAIQDQIGVVRIDMLQIADASAADVDRARMSTAALTEVEGAMRRRGGRQPECPVQRQGDHRRAGAGQEGGRADRGGCRTGKLGRTSGVRSGVAAETGHRRACPPPSRTSPRPQTNCNPGSDRTGATHRGAPQWTTYKICPPPLTAPDRTGDPSQPQQFVTFYLGSDCFAFPMATVLEIIRVPQVVKVPLTPPGFVGLANLRGAIPADHGPAPADRHGQPGRR